MTRILNHEEVEIKVRQDNAFVTRLHLKDVEVEDKLDSQTTTCKHEYRSIDLRVSQGIMVGDCWVPIVCEHNQVVFSQECFH